MMLGERCQKKSAMPLQIRDIDEGLPYAASTFWIRALPKRDRKDNPAKIQ